MNVLSLFFMLSAVFCARKYRIITFASPEERDNVKSFVKHHLPNLYRFSKLRNGSELSKDDHEQLATTPFTDFLWRIFSQFKIQGEGINVFLSMYNQHRPAAKASRESIMDAIKSVLAWYKIELKEDKNTEENVKEYLLTLFYNYNDYIPDMKMDDEVFYLFMTLLVYRQIVPVEALIENDSMDCDEEASELDETSNYST